VAPLRRAADADEVDTSTLTLDEVVDAVVAIVERTVA
jgi:cytidylate kinase